MDQTFSLSALRYEEQAVYALRALYRRCGYQPYKMSKFEEYDFYLHNKDFLVSDHIITFTDTDGKLMALKPDVTLSIIKNGKDVASGVRKVCYNENVYRAANGTRSFREIMQVGLECIGDVGEYDICEVLTLAAESLSTISSEYVLDLSHLGVLSAVMSHLRIPPECESRVIECIGNKNRHELHALLDGCGVDASPLEKLVTCYGAPEEVLPVLKSLGIPALSEPVAQMERVTRTLAARGFGGRVRIDFSVVNDVHYYNGFVFKGFVDGISSGVLSGGQYDNLMRRLGKKARAVGFAVYLDELERLDQAKDGCDVDVLLLYDDKSSPQDISDAVTRLLAGGERVTAQKCIPENIRWKRIEKLTEGKVTPDGQHA